MLGLFTYVKLYNFQLWWFLDLPRSETANLVTFKRNADLIFKLKFLCREECPYDSIEKFERQRSSVRPSVHIFKSVTFEKHESNGLLFCSMIQHFWWIYSFVFEIKKCRNRHLQSFNFLHFPLQLPYCYFRHFQKRAKIEKKN